MEISVSVGCAVNVCIIIFVTFIIWKALNLVFLTPKRLERCLREQGLKGNSYRALSGDFKLLSAMLLEAQSKPINVTDDIVPYVVPFHHWTVKNYGKNSYIWTGPKPMVNIMKPDEIKDVLNKWNDFPKLSKSPLAKFLLCGLINVEGQKWAKHRKIINPAFHQEKLKLVLPALYQSCNQTINKWEALVSKNGSCELDVWPFLDRLSGDVISRTAFGSSYKEGMRLFQLQKEQAQLTAMVLRSIYVPGWRFVPTKMNKRMKEIEKEVQALLRSIIHKREKAMAKGLAPTDDLLGLLLESNHREMKERGNKDVGLSITEVINECKLFYLAGQETTSSLLNWTMVLLSRFPSWQSRAREEVMQVFSTQKADYDGLNRLKVVTMILYEVLRLYPPVTMISREVKKESRLGNLTLPSGTRISMPIILVHHEREIWGEDAKEFRPERFSEGISKATNGQVSFLPFGWGPRIYIGQNLALLEAKMALSLILQHFSFELSPTYAHSPISVLTLQPQFGTQVILHKL